jgi:diguanylate cyclase (GGDEF)-like protein/PAS domain S-box-containing protein
MIGQPTPISASPPTAPAVAPQAAQTILSGYAGPAFYALDGRIVQGNGAAEVLVEHDRSWLKPLEDWLANFTQTGSRTPVMVKVPSDGAEVTLEWSMVLLDEGQVLVARNVTLERNLQAVLTESRDRFRDLVDMMAEMAWEVNKEGILTYVVGSKSFGYMPEQLIGTRANNLVVRALMDQDKYFESERMLPWHEVKLRLAGGAVARAMLTVKPIIDAQGVWRGARGLCRDVSAERTQQEQLARLQQRDQMLARFLVSLREAKDVRTALNTAANEMRTALQAAGVQIMSIDDAGGLDIAAEVGAALPERVRTLMRELDRGQPPAIIHDNSPGSQLMGATIRHGAQLNGVVWLWRPSEQGEWSEAEITLLSEVTDHLGAVISEITYQDKLVQLSQRDGLTGLLNRRTFMEQLAARMQQAAGSAALFYFDLDNFKAVNDTHGHQSGDQVIGRLAALIKQQLVLHPQALAGRLGGDEFVLWLEDQAKVQVEALGAQLVAKGNQELRPLSASADCPLGLSIGVVYLDSLGNLTPKDIIEQADRAMYQAKNMGKNTWAMVEI